MTANITDQLHFAIFLAKLGIWHQFRIYARLSVRLWLIASFDAFDAELASGSDNTHFIFFVSDIQMLFIAKKKSAELV